MQLTKAGLSFKVTFANDLVMVVLPDTLPKDGERRINLFHSVIYQSLFYLFICKIASAMRR